MADSSAIATALVQKVRDAKSVYEKRSATDTLLVRMRREGRCAELAAAGAIRAVVKVFMECDEDDETRSNCAEIIGCLALQEENYGNIGISDSVFLEAMVDFLPNAEADGYNSVAYALYYLIIEDRTMRQALRDVPNIFDALHTNQETCDYDLRIDDVLHLLLPLSTSGKRIKPARAYIENGTSANRRSRAG